MTFFDRVDWENRYQRRRVHVQLRWETLSIQCEEYLLRLCDLGRSAAHCFFSGLWSGMHGMCCTCDLASGTVSRKVHLFFFFSFCLKSFLILITPSSLIRFFFSFFGHPFTARIILIFPLSHFAQYFDWGYFVFLFCFVHSFTLIYILIRWRKFQSFKLFFFVRRCCRWCLLRKILRDLQCTWRDEDCSIVNSYTTSISFSIWIVVFATASSGFLLSFFVFHCHWVKKKKQKLWRNQHRSVCKRHSKKSWNGTRMSNWLSKFVFIRWSFWHWRNGQLMHTHIHIYIHVSSISECTVSMKCEKPSVFFFFLKTKRNIVLLAFVANWEILFSKT